jgi:hypothetical protein|tara:strand:+ start:54 stop:440 length:387 start_codon:yes stop_codon:yes gene_type:complete
MIADKYYSQEYGKIDRLKYFKYWKPEFQDLKNYCFNDLDKCKWNDPESFESHFSIMTKYLGKKIYWDNKYEGDNDILEFIGYDIETIDSIGISEDTYDTQELYFFNKDKSRWFDLDYALNHLLNEEDK